MSTASPAFSDNKSESTSLGSLDKNLRPDNWDDYIGQDEIKKSVRLFVQAAKNRGEPAEHILFYGPPGLGKTTLAHLIANETGAVLRSTSGPAIERAGDLASILANLEPNDILFIDEIHRLSRSAEEALYPALEAGVELTLPPFTLIAATTRPASLSAPLRSRFGGGTYRLEYYTDQHITDILKRSATLLGVNANDDAHSHIASRARSTPRTANYLLKRARDVAEIDGVALDKATAKKALDLLGIDNAGLTEFDRQILRTIKDTYRGGPVGIGTLAANLSEEVATLEEHHEPYLLRAGFIERTPRGRTITERGIQHLQDQQG